MARTREVFEASTDFTLAVEEEFQILDPETLALAQRYTELRAATDADPVLADAVAGELIESEIEIRSGRCENWGEVVYKQQEARGRLFRTAAESVPRCGIPDHYGSFEEYAEYVDFLTKAGSIVEATQIWWSIRPHHSFGTVELRICDAQTGGDESLNLAGLLIASIAQAAMDEDEGVPFSAHPHRLIEENFWRAIRHGLDG